MGMFDTIRCLAPLPDGFDATNTSFQTKDLDSVMEQYDITADGRLIAHRVEYEECPEEERPYFGKPEWETSPMVRFFGMLRPKRQYTEEDPFHGDVEFYTNNICLSGPDAVETYDDLPPQRREYTARFTDGRLTRITGGAELLECSVPHRTRGTRIERSADSE
jgi:hypothetical protein